MNKAAIAIQTENNSGSYHTYCANNDWLLYGATKTSLGELYTHWTISPVVTAENYIMGKKDIGSIGWHQVGYNNYRMRYTVYLKADTMFAGKGIGTWDNPYEIEY